jgi:type VI secretion system protein ImpM
VTSAASPPDAFAFLDEGTPAAVAPGWFGKLSLLGDFASRRLPVPFTEACDRWLSRCVDTSRAQLGERWLQVYLTSPLWRFAWAPGVAGAGDAAADSRWWLGVLMPSVDAVGRYFPLLIATPCDQPPQRPADIATLERWFEALVQAAVATLLPGASVDGFEAALAAAPAWHAAADIGAQRHESAQRSRIQLPHAGPLAAALGALAAHETLQRLRGCSVWWPVQPAEQPHHFSVAAGLPPPEAFAQMLEGSW